MQHNPDCSKGPHCVCDPSYEHEEHPLPGVLVDSKWTVDHVVALDAPLSIGARVDVYRRGIDYSTTYEGEYEVTHLYRYSNDCQPGDDYIAVCSPGTAHVTIVHQADLVPLVPTEWAAGLRVV